MNEEDWTLQVIDRMDRFYRKFYGDLGDTIEEMVLKEGWRRLAVIESLKPITSSVHWPKKDLPNARAKFIGGLTGHSVSHQEAMYHPKLWKLVCDALNLLISLPTGSSEEPDRLDVGENLFLYVKPQYNAAITSVMRIASRQSSSEQIHFFEGYTKALRRGSITINARGFGETTRTSAFTLIAAFSSVIQLRCYSVHDVHRFLENMLGRQRAGTIKRTESVCHAIGLRFRSAGRPPKNQKNKSSRPTF